jgi:hypothetical protein
MMISALEEFYNHSIRRIFIMNRLFYLFVSLIILSGCATKMAYLNTQKLPEEVKKDKTDCQSIVDVSDLKDSGSKQKSSMSV